ncbi:hypothetical protein P2H44_18390 [Albimonas sp. CAU 1670]|uniref:hypothetical protein n=1 Tax=Albimonas sp. CAU 1670 TaxID=3032599 RepID=UPI0023DB99AA|nr:hypothetical protein [Albimonas sp. CAU 1670]MDF2234534.1 hypothetical protein [Albimonas sp. CAU 1670]
MSRPDPRPAVRDALRRGGPARSFCGTALPRAALALAAATALAACVPPGAPKPGQTPPAQAAAAIQAGGRTVVITPPTGFCVDPGSVRPQGAAAFVLIEDCALAGAADALTAADAAPDQPIAQPATVDGLVTLSIGDHPLFESAPEAGFKALEAFLRSSDGRASAGLGGDPSVVKIVETRQVADTLYVLVEDKGQHVVPVLGERFWRAFTEVNDRALIASLGVFDSSSMKDGAKLGHLARVVTALKEGNGDATDAAELRLAATAPVAAPAPTPAPDAPPKPGQTETRRALALGPAGQPPRQRPGG